MALLNRRYGIKEKPTATPVSAVNSDVFSVVNASKPPATPAAPYRPPALTNAPGGGNGNVAGEMMLMAKDSNWRKQKMEATKTEVARVRERIERVETRNVMTLEEYMPADAVARATANLAIMKLNTSGFLARKVPTRRSPLPSRARYIPPCISHIPACYPLSESGA